MEEILFRREVVEERLLGDVRILCDLVDAGVVEALADEAFHRHRHDAIADLSLASFAPAEVIVRVVHAGPPEPVAYSILKASGGL